MNSEGLSKFSILWGCDSLASLTEKQVLRQDCPRWRREGALHGVKLLRAINVQRAGQKRLIQLSLPILLYSAWGNVPQATK